MAAANTAAITALAQDLAATKAAINDGWTMFAGCLVFWMQGGFTMLESGSVRMKNSQSIILKNLVDVCVGALGWYSFGFALAFGEDNKNPDGIEEDGIAGYGGFAGTTSWFTQDKHLSNAGTSSTGPGESGSGFAFWFFQFTFCATCATIVSGALAERTQLVGFIIFNIVQTAFVYPIIVHWTWGYGWLYMQGYTDFAGSGVVHLAGGWAALIAAIAVGPRLRRFPEKGAVIERPANRPFLAKLMNLPPNPHQPNSVLSVVMGTFILWFGWFGFNGGSTVALTDGAYITAGRACVNTTLAGAFGGVTAILMAKNMDDDNKLCLCSFANGILAGLVAITAGCNAVDTWAAVLIGILGGIFMCLSTAVLAKLGIDDPLGAYPVHGANGIWGVISTGLFHMDKGLLGYDAEGTFSKTDGKGCMAGNIIGVLAICAWITATIGPTFFLINKAGLLRVSAEIEKAGVDIELVTYDPALAVSRPQLAAKENAKPVGPDTTLGDA